MRLYRLWNKLKYCKYDLILIVTLIHDPIPSLGRKLIF